LKRLKRLRKKLKNLNQAQQPRLPERQDEHPTTRVKSNGGSAKTRYASKAF
jgi:hypothetical protein